MREWCLAATQLRDPKGCSSVLGVMVDEVIDVVDETFREWIDTRLDMTMEVRLFPILPSPCKTRKVGDPENGRTSADAIEPTDHDILFGRSVVGRGGSTNNHPGNVHFHKVALELQPVYVQLTKAGKYYFSIVLLERMKNENRRFLEKSSSDGLWYEVNNKRAREKARQALTEPPMKKDRLDDFISPDFEESFSDELVLFTWVNNGL